MSGISLDREGHVWVVERCGANSCAGSNVAPVLELDPLSGSVLKSFGEGMFVYPHAIYVDKADNDSVWVVDQSAKDGKGEQVWKFSPQGKVLMVLGKAGITGGSPDAFNDPTGVVVGNGGDIFVSDGHKGTSQSVARIAKFSKNGTFLTSWGSKGSGPGELDDPHSITIDSKGRLLVADRGNLRIDIFDQNGALLGQWKQFGIPSSVFVDEHDTLYVAQNFLRPQAAGFKRGIRVGSLRDGKVTAFIEDPNQDATNPSIGPESVIADKAGALYVGEVDRKMIKKYVPK
ncbi:MAG TPA: peptidyl-alpha-hydroxyglycine alpha-amidating lyase family protein [Acidobacteriaceae bacterium]